jgi:carbon starvation protein
MASKLAYEQQKLAPGGSRLMTALPIVVGALCVLAIAYRYYSAFIAAKVLALDDTRATPAHAMNDGQNYHPTNKWVLFGHHFAAITGAGPLLGPVLAAQFGYAPGLLWILIGVTLGGAVHDFVILAASIRHNGRSLAEIARSEMGRVAGVVCAVAVLIIIMIAIASMGKAVVTALAESSWGTFTIGASIPIALFMGVYLYRIRVGRVRETTLIGVTLLTVAVVAGEPISHSALGEALRLSPTSITIAIAAYGFIASVLPVWLLLCPRDYLSAFMKVGTIGLLVITVLIVNPELKLPAFADLPDGRGPVVPGSILPFVFITIACGAISGFHALISSGTTPKMIDRETDARLIGYGSMLLEGLVAVISLVTTAALLPEDYLAINANPLLHAANPVELPALAAAIGEENLVGRTGGAVSLAVGVAKIASEIPGLSGLLKYFYHFMIMFEALFVLTTIDTGTRVARFLVQEAIGRVYRPFYRTDWLPGTLVASAIVVAAWSYFLFTGTIGSLWPMLGIANQLLASIALAVGTTYLINAGRRRYAWVTLLPLSFVASSTLVAGYLRITETLLPLIARGEQRGANVVNLVLIVVMMVAVVIILGAGLRRWFRPAALVPGAVGET